MLPPQGTLVPIGGAEDKGAEAHSRRHPFFRRGVLQRLTAMLPKGKEAAIEIVTAACSEPEDAFSNYRSAFEKLGFPTLGHFCACSRAETDEAENLERLAAADLVLLAGGDQLRLSAVLGGTRAMGLLKDRYQNEPLILAGTSAGAMVMGATMIFEGNATQAHLKGAVRMAPGLGLLPEAVVDTHFDQRGRFNRIAQAVAAAPGIVGIGLDEDTGVLLREGCRLEVIGSGSVTVIDGLSIGYNTIGDISTDMPLSVEGLKVHLLARGDVYDLGERRYQGAGKG